MMPSSRRIARTLESLTGEVITATSLQGLQRLVDEQVPEGTQLDYKFDAYDSSTKDTRDELRKDVTALANASGGVLILGVADNEGIPRKVLGLKGNLEKTEGRLRQTLSSRLEPFLDGVEIVEVPSASGTNGCLLVVVPASSRKPHAVRPMGDDEALKFARRAGRHTEWLSEAQVADLYRNRFADSHSQESRLGELDHEGRAALAKRAWLLITLVPDEVGVFAVNRATEATVDDWWRRRERLDLIPGVPQYATGPPSIGPQQVVIGRLDDTGAPAGIRVSFHADGSSVVATELGVAGHLEDSPSLYLDRLVGVVIDSVEASAAFATGLAGTGGLAAVQARLHFPEWRDTPIQCWDPSWVPNPTSLPRTPLAVLTRNTLDLDSIFGSPPEVVAAASLIAGGIAQHFGEPDARYLTPDGRVRIQQFHARERDHHVLPRVRQHGIPTHDKVAMT